MSACAGSEPFALQVLGNSMEPEFSDGAIIIVEPGMVVTDQCFVVAQLEQEFILRQLLIDGEQMQLKALNDQYPAIDIAGLQQIRGRVIERCGRRRKDRKAYP